MKLFITFLLLTAPLFVTAQVEIGMNYGILKPVIYEEMIPANEYAESSTGALNVDIDFRHDNEGAVYFTLGFRQGWFTMSTPVRMYSYIPVSIGNNQLESASIERKSISYMYIGTLGALQACINISNSAALRGSVIGGVNLDCNTGWGIPQPEKFTPVCGAEAGIMLGSRITVSARYEHFFQSYEYLHTDNRRKAPHMDVNKYRLNAMSLYLKIYCGKRNRLKWYQ